jgi:Bacterial regulatory proteins, tetR family
MAQTGKRTTVNSEAVLDAALTLFAERGYHGTALSQIADALGLRVPSLVPGRRAGLCRAGRDRVQRVRGPDRGGRMTT